MLLRTGQPEAKMVAPHYENTCTATGDTECHMKHNSFVHLYPLITLNYTIFVISVQQVINSPWSKNWGHRTTVRVLTLYLRHEIWVTVSVTERQVQCKKNSDVWVTCWELILKTLGFKVTERGCVSFSYVHIVIILNKLVLYLHKIMFQIVVVNHHNIH